MQRGVSAARVAEGETADEKVKGSRDFQLQFRMRGYMRGGGNLPTLRNELSTEAFIATLERETNERPKLCPLLQSAYLR